MDVTSIINAFDWALCYADDVTLPYAMIGLRSRYLPKTLILHLTIKRLVASNLIKNLLVVNMCT